MADRAHILLVNDDPDGLFLLERATAKEFPGVVILKSRDASTALDLLDCFAVDAIVTDNRMPGMRGVDLIRAVRSRGATMPVLMLTGSEAAREEAMAAGASLFLSNGSWAEIRTRMRELFRF
jgi:two-component system KDP operon response regulator KdpE